MLAKQILKKGVSNAFEESTSDDCAKIVVGIFTQVLTDEDFAIVVESLESEILEKLRSLIDDELAGR